MMKITKEDFISSEEIWDNVFKCPKCKEECILQGDKYCSDCGVKLEWDEEALKIPI